MAFKQLYKFDLGLASDGVTQRQYAVKLFERCYKNFAGLIGMSKATPKQLDGYEVLTIREAVSRAILLPLKISYQKTARKRQGATIFVPRDKVEEALRQVNGLKKKEYLGFPIVDVRIPTDKTTTY